MSNVDYIEGWTWHGRKGDHENAFRYSVDYVLFDATHEKRNCARISLLTSWIHHKCINASVTV